MSLYRNSVISQVPVNFRHANALRRTSVTALSEPGMFLICPLRAAEFYDGAAPQNMWHQDSM